MKDSFKILVFLGCLVTLSCREQTAEPIDTASLNLSFRAIYNGEPLILNESYPYDGNAVQFSRVNFYLANLVAVNDDGETGLSEIQFIDLTITHNTLADAAKGTIMTFDRVPVGTYNYLRFGVGVSTDLNKTIPSDYSTIHPLGVGNSSEYREDLGSYIFAKIEGVYDKDGNGDFDENDISFKYHAVGLGNFFQPLEFGNELILNAGETISLNFELDIRTLLSFPRGGLINLQPYDASNQSAEVNQIMNNFIEALQLN